MRNHKLRYDQSLWTIVSSHLFKCEEDVVGHNCNCKKKDIVKHVFKRGQVECKLPHFQIRKQETKGVILTGSSCQQCFTTAPRWRSWKRCQGDLKHHPDRCGHQNSLRSSDVSECSPFLTKLRKESPMMPDVHRKRFVRVQSIFAKGLWSLLKTVLLKWFETLTSVNTKEKCELCKIVMHPPSQNSRNGGQV